MSTNFYYIAYKRSGRKLWWSNFIFFFIYIYKFYNAILKIFGKFGVVILLKMFCEDKEKDISLPQSLFYSFKQTSIYKTFHETLVFLMQWCIKEFIHSMTNLSCLDICLIMLINWQCFQEFKASLLHMNYMKYIKNIILLMCL